MPHRDPREQLRQAHVIATDHHCKIVERTTQTGRTYLLYRIVNGRAVFIGRRSSESGIHSLVCKACDFH